MFECEGRIIIISLERFSLRNGSAVLSLVSTGEVDDILQRAASLKAFTPKSVLRALQHAICGQGEDRGWLIHRRLTIIRFRRYIPEGRALPTSRP